MIVSDKGYSTNTHLRLFITTDAYKFHNNFILYASDNFFYSLQKCFVHMIFKKFYDTYKYKLQTMQIFSTISCHPGTTSK